MLWTLAVSFWHKHVQSNIPPYYKSRKPLISYSGSWPIVPKLFNYKQALQDLTTDDLISHASDRDCASSHFPYDPAGHVITGDLNIVKNNKLKESLSKGPKFREPQSFSWNQKLQNSNGFSWRLRSTLGQDRRSWDRNTLWVGQCHSVIGQNQDFQAARDD